MKQNVISCTSKLQTRFNDLDMAGHVHNSEYLNYFEIGRIDFFSTVIDPNWDWKNKGILVARNEVDYLKPIYFEDEITIETFFEDMGKKSLTLGYKLTKVQNGEIQVCAEGRSILVCFDFKLNSSVEVFPEWRAKLED